MQRPAAAPPAKARRPGVSRCNSSAEESRLSANARVVPVWFGQRAQRGSHTQTPTTSAQTICREAPDKKEDDQREQRRAPDSPSPRAGSSEKTESRFAGRR